MKKLGILLIISLFCTELRSQELDFALAAKKEIAPSVSFQKTYGLGAKKKFEIGWGVRANAYFSGEKDYITAPAELTSGKQSIIGLFTEYKPDKLDTLNLTKSSLASFNAMIILQYKFKKSAIGFNIDALGFTVGGKQSGIFHASDSQTFNNTLQTAAPTRGNILLISDSDHGSLNSELYYKQIFNNQNALRFGLSFQFLEYTTERVLTYENDRFRHKTLMPFIAYNIKLNK